MPAPLPSTDVAVWRRLSAQGALGPARMLAAIGLAGTLVAAVVIGALHLLPQTAGISPVTRTISEYALTDVGCAVHPGCALAVRRVAGDSRGVGAGGSGQAWVTGVLFGVLWSAALLAWSCFPSTTGRSGPARTGRSTGRPASSPLSACRWRCCC